MQMQQPLPRQPSDPQHMKREFAQPETMLPSQAPPPPPPPAPRGGGYMPPPEYGAPPPHQPPQPSDFYSQSSPYAAVPAQPRRSHSGAARSTERQGNGRDIDELADRDPQGSSAVSRQAGAAGEALSAGPTVKEAANGERRVASSEEVGGGGGGREPEGGFTAVNT